MNKMVLIMFWMAEQRIMEGEDSLLPSLQHNNGTQASELSV